MTTYHITNRTTGLDMGVYPGATPADALAAMIADAGSSGPECDPTLDDVSCTEETETTTTRTITIYTETARATLRGVDLRSRVTDAEWASYLDCLRTACAAEGCELRVESGAGDVTGTDEEQWDVITDAAHRAWCSASQLTPTLNDEQEVQRAIDDSRSTNSIITIPWTAGVWAELQLRADDTADTDDVLEAWGSDWRVHIDRRTE